MSGTKYDDKKPMMALVPPEALEEEAWVWTFGANKYKQLDFKEFINWANSQNVKINVISQSKQGACVAVVMIDGLRSKIQNMQKDKQKIAKLGEKEIPKNVKLLQSAEKRKSLNGQTLERESINLLRLAPLTNENTESLLLNEKNFLKNKGMSALSAKSPQKSIIQTIATSLGELEEFFVVSATTDLDFSETILKVLGLQLNTLEENNLLKAGVFNWRKGLSFLRIISAMMRHTNAIVKGQDIDPESGRHHGAHVRCCAAMLIEFYKDGRVDLDDRYKSEFQDLLDTGERFMDLLEDIEKKVEAEMDTGARAFKLPPEYGGESS